MRLPPAARWLAGVAVVLALGGCQFPADTNGTLERVRDGTLRVGVTPADPFVILADGSEPQGWRPRW